MHSYLLKERLELYDVEQNVFHLRMLKVFKINLCTYICIMYGLLVL